MAADTVVIDTGTRSAIPPLPGPESLPSLTSTTGMELGELPP